MHDEGWTTRWVRETVTTREMDEDEIERALAEWARRELELSDDAPVTVDLLEGQTLHARIRYTRKEEGGPDAS